jgi:Holliday junction resolvase
MNRRGINRERQVRLHLEADDWWVARAAGSFGDADLVALKDGRRPRLIEVKSSAKGPYEHFGPSEREGLRRAARLAGAIAELAWWPKGGQLRFIPSDEWPRTKP